MSVPRFHRLAVKFAAAVYEPSAGDVRNAIHGPRVCPSVAEIIEGPAPLHERVLVVPTSAAVFVVFRGTRTPRQWLGNFNARKVVWLFSGRCHAGFLNAFLSVKDSVLAAIMAWKTHKPLVLAGHSRGAPSALYLALLLRLTGFNIAEIHLFGCPRGLAPKIANRFDAWFPRTWNWIANNDAVHRVPFKWMGFRHVGTRMYFDADDALQIDPAWTLKLKGQFLGRLRGGWLDGLSDHSAAKEYERLIGPLEFN